MRTRRQRKRDWQERWSNPPPFVRRILQNAERTVERTWVLVEPSNEHEHVIIHEGDRA